MLYYAKYMTNISFSLEFFLLHFLELLNPRRMCFNQIVTFSFLINSKDQLPFNVNVLKMKKKGIKEN